MMLLVKLPGREWRGGVKFCSPLYGVNSLRQPTAACKPNASKITPGQSFPQMRTHQTQPSPGTNPRSDVSDPHPSDPPPSAPPPTPFAAFHPPSSLSPPSRQQLSKPLLVLCDPQLMLGALLLGEDHVLLELDLLGPAGPSEAAQARSWRGRGLGWGQAGSGRLCLMGDC